jgi:hypothetical protein
MLQLPMGTALMYESTNFLGRTFAKVIIVHQNFELSLTIHFFEAVPQIPEQDIAGRGCDFGITHVDRERVEVL